MREAWTGMYTLGRRVPRVDRHACSVDIALERGQACTHLGGGSREWTGMRAPGRWIPSVDTHPQGAAGARIPARLNPPTKWVDPVREKLMGTL